MKFLTGFNMSKIRSRDTKPEILVRKFLFGKGLDTSFMTGFYRASLISFSQSIRQLFLFTDVSGMGMRDFLDKERVKLRRCQ